MAEIKRLRYLVELASEPIGDHDPDDLEVTTHEATVILGDQLRGELEANRRSLDLKANPFHLTALWCWASLVRRHVVDVKFPEFSERVVAIDEDKAGESEADPTRPGASSGSA